MDFLPDDDLARLHQINLDAKAGVDASDDEDDEVMTYAEWVKLAIAPTRCAAEKFEERSLL
jgi:hypothetical protein